jgi:hypothetical protein
MRQDNYDKRGGHTLGQVQGARGRMQDGRSRDGRHHLKVRKGV